jgi:hypothetical protein
MKVRKIGMSDACEVTGYTRDQIRGLLRDLPEFITTPMEGKNRLFSRVELLMVTIITELEQRYGTKRAAIGHILEQLLSTLNTPRSVNATATLNILFAPPSVTYMPESIAVPEGLVVPLGPIFKRVDIYLGAHSEDIQSELALGPVIVRKYAN